MGKAQTIIVVAVAYLALGALSAYFAYSDQDAWGVWLTSGLGLGLLLGRERAEWMPVLVGAFVGAMIFEPMVGSSMVDSLGYALIEVVVIVAGGVAAARMSPLPLRFVSPRDVAAIVAGSLALALTGAVLVGAWDYFTGQPGALRVFGVWLLGNFVAMLLVASFIASWSQLRLERPHVRTLLSFFAGAVACALFLFCIHALFSGVRGGPLQPLAAALGVLPFVFILLVALLWGARGATLAALLGALIAITQTVRGLGPFSDHDGLVGDPVLTAQGYAVALSITGLLIATFVQARRGRAAQLHE